MSQPIIKRLLDAAATNTVGTTVCLGSSNPPYTIYTTGGYSVSGILIEGLAELGGTALTLMGKVGGATTPAEVAALTGLVNLTVVMLDYNPGYIRATYATGGTGTATVFLVYND